MRITGYLIGLLLAWVVLAGCGGDSDSSSDSSGVGAGPAAEALALEVGDVNVAALTAGDEGAALSVVFLHGASLTKQDWDDLGILSTVADAGFQAVAVDLPGFGETPESDADPAQFLLDLFDAMDRPANEVVLVSPSMSGRFSLPLVALDPPVDLAGFVPVAPVGVDEFPGRTRDNPVPALIMWAAGDNVIPFTVSDRLQAKLPGSTKIAFELDNHALYRADTAGFNQALLRFVRNL
jgi:abhydrolase domain-containing protein 14